MNTNQRIGLFDDEVFVACVGGGFAVQACAAGFLIWLTQTEKVLFLRCSK